MLDGVGQNGTETGADPGWYAFVRARIEGGHDQLYQALGCPQDAEALEFRLLKRGSRAFSLECRAGTTSALLKIFCGPDAGAAYAREKMSLMVMAPTGLVPGVLAVSDQRHFLLEHWHNPVAWPETSQRAPAVAAARRIGDWIARFDARAPAGNRCGNWFEYLTKCGGDIDLGQVPCARDILCDIPLCGTVLSRNDGALHNFLETPTGDLVGCDFENARMKPRGWDYIQGYISLIERYPEAAQQVIQAYAEGFSRAHRGALLVNELNDVARILFCARATLGRAPQEVLSWQ